MKHKKNIIIIRNKCGMERKRPVFPSDQEHNKNVVNEHGPNIADSSVERRTGAAVLDQTQLNIRI